MLVWSENVFKGTCSSSFHGQRNFVDKNFCVMDTPWLLMIDLKCCSHSFNRLLQKSMPTIFLIMSYSASAAILWQNFEITFWTKTVKNRLFQKIFENKKNAYTVSFRSWLYEFQWETTIENHKCVVAGAHKIENLVLVCPILTLIFLIFGEHEKDSKYILEVLEYIAEI